MPSKEKDVQTTTVKILTPQEFGDLFDSFTESAFRFESLDRYLIPEEEIEFARFLSGEPLPAADKDEWAQFIKQNVKHGKRIQRVHAVSIPLTPYIKFEIDWGYLFGSDAGEDIYLIDRELAPEVARTVSDFWLFDRRTLVTMKYDPEGRFIHGIQENDPSVISTHIEVMLSVLKRAIPLRAFLAEMRNA